MIKELVFVDYGFGLVSGREEDFPCEELARYEDSAGREFFLSLDVPGDFLSREVEEFTPIKELTLYFGEGVEFESHLPEWDAERKNAEEFLANL